MTRKKVLAVGEACMSAPTLKGGHLSAVDSQQGGLNFCVRSRLLHCERRALNKNTMIFNSVDIRQFWITLTGSNNIDIQASVTRRGSNTS